MLEYLVLAWPEGEAEAARQAAALTDRIARRPDLRLAWSTPGTRVWMRRRPAVRWRPFAGGRGMVIGDIFADDSLWESGDDFDARAAFTRLCKHGWGSYVAVTFDTTGAPAVFRDPTGALDALTWRIGSVQVVASDLDAGLLAIARPPGLAIDWEIVGDLLRNPALVAERLPLEGVLGVAPGVMVDASGETRLWRPTTFVAQGEGPPPPRDLADRRAYYGARLARTLDACVAAWTTRHPRVVAEVSGGLDSAIVASALVASRADVLAALNFHPPQAQADERPFARAVARRNGLDLTCLPKPSIRFTPRSLARGAGSVRPGFNRIDHDYDRDVAARAGRLEAGAILGGQGGDAVLFRDAAPVIAIDTFAALGWRALRPSVLEPLAWWTRRSVWDLVRIALASGLGRGPSPGLPANDILSPALRASPREVRHPWVIGAAKAPAAKRMQILTIANCQLFQGDCARKRAAALVHPLLSQPLVEFCLSVSTYDLTLGRGDRALARWAFRDRLPADIVHRRTKGETTTFYGHGLVDGLDQLRPYLVQGRLVEQGLLDAEPLAVRLDPDDLARTGEVMNLLLAAMLEAWVRHWEAAIARPRPATKPKAKASASDCPPAS